MQFWNLQAHITFLLFYYSFDFNEIWIKINGLLSTFISNTNMQLLLIFNFPLRKRNTFSGGKSIKNGLNPFWKRVYSKSK